MLLHSAQHCRVAVLHNTDINAPTHTRPHSQVGFCGGLFFTLSVLPYTEQKVGGAVLTEETVHVCLLHCAYTQHAQAHGSSCTVHMHTSLLTPSPASPTGPDRARGVAFSLTLRFYSFSCAMSLLTTTHSRSLARLLTTLSLTLTSTPQYPSRRTRSAAVVAHFYPLSLWWVL